MPITKASGQAVAPAAKGDLVVGSATNDAAVLGVGSADQVLTVDSSTTTGLKWATPSGGGMTLLATTTMASTTTSVSGISGSYNNLMMIVDNCYLNNFDPAVVKINSTTGNIQAQRIYNSTVTNVNSLIGGANLTTSSGVANMVLIIYNYASTSSTKPFELIINGLAASTGPNIWLGSITSTSAVTSVDFTTNNGTATWSGGTIKTYGVK